MIVDPASGQALADDRVAIVVAPTATDAEAYSKALLVWGPAGVARLEQIDGVGAAVVSGQGIEIGRALRRGDTFAPLPVPQPLRRAEAGLTIRTVWGEGYVLEEMPQ